MRKITIAALLLAALTATAFAQQKEDRYADEDRAKAREAATIDKQYKTILELTDKPASTKVDPWRNMRGADKAKPNR